MTAIYFSTHACHASDLVEGSEETIQHFILLNNIGPSGRLLRGQAYTLDLVNPYATSLVNTLNHSTQQERNWLMTAVVFEGEEIHREAAFWEHYLSNEALSPALSLIGATGASAQVKSRQLSSFHQALVRYENALLAIQSPAAPGMPGAGARNAEAIRNANQAYNALMTEHRAAMASLAPAVMRAKNRGGAINNAQRGITLAHRSRSGRVDPRLLVADLFQAHRLKNFASYMSKAATPLTLAVDATLRAGKVRSVNQSDGNWHRESYRQVGGFLGSAFGGGLAAGATFKAGKLVAAKYGIAIIGVGIGPIGWAVLGCIVVVSAGVALAASNQAGPRGERLGDIIYNLSR
ncbi:hypothetical protein [Nitrincola nitratireducens]|uniref:Uncharacterized protein n=1 Tax=Nitrincola nitratireducens TaxID=1229521 RepID=W9UYZ3_9GAMM|nr:hypothetical protein [Nitrincola nitratireducens]EXJ09132.1 hypothetical protein D791_03919 [Nitrincola nitratireducens]